MQPRTRLMSALTLSAAMLFGASAAEAQNAVSSADSPQIYWIYSATVNSGRLDDFKQLVTEAVANTAKEPHTLEYQYSLSPDQKSIDIVERYVDSAAVVTHVNGLKAKFGKRFVEDVTGTHFAVYGPVSAEAKDALTGFNAVYMMSSIDGFVR